MVFLCDFINRIAQKVLMWSFGMTVLYYSERECAMSLDLIWNSL